MNTETDICDYRPRICTAEPAVCIFRVEEAILEVINCSLTWIFLYQTVRHYIPEDRGLSIGGCDNLKFLMLCAVECAIRHTGRPCVQL
jgi:hypothetical protein